MVWWGQVLFAVAMALLLGCGVARGLAWLGAARIQDLRIELALTRARLGAGAGALLGAVVIALALRAWLPDGGLAWLMAPLEGWRWWFLGVALSLVALALYGRAALLRLSHLAPGSGDDAAPSWSLLRLILLVLAWALAAFVAAALMPAPHGVLGGPAVLLTWLALGGLLWAASMGPLGRLQARRADRRILQPEEVTPLGLGPDNATQTGRRIVIFCDGTRNSPEQMVDGRRTATNVWRMREALLEDDTQTARYDSGVGAGGSSSTQLAARLQGALSGLTVLAPVAMLVGWWRAAWLMLEAATGTGITENITRAYVEIVRQYTSGDRIYLIGFSRGAYTARCVAGVIRRCGLLKAEHVRLAPEVVQLYRGRRDQTKAIRLEPALLHDVRPAADGKTALPQTPVEFLGLFDTVASLGVPLWGWWFNFRKIFQSAALNSSPAPICRHIYHALAMHETRSQFRPSLLDAPKADDFTWTRRSEQRWFAGNHSDVGGGYVETGLSDIPLTWMLDAAERHGLTFAPTLRASLSPNPMARPHDELRRGPTWRIFGSWPRWHPAEPGRTPWGRLDESVWQRAQVFSARMGRAWLRPVLPEGETFSILADLEWCSTGLVLEKDKTYRLGLKQGSWRDFNCPPCGPGGQEAGSGVRRYTAWALRQPDALYMQLCLTIAHPRDWPLRERGLATLFRYLFWRAPEELLWQVAPVGRDLAKGEVFLSNFGETGMLHGFANDLWAFAGNNSGAIELTIQEVAELPAGARVWALRSAADGMYRWAPP